MTPTILNPWPCVTISDKVVLFQFSLDMKDDLMMMTMLVLSLTRC